MDSGGDGDGGRLRLQNWPLLAISVNRHSLNRASAVRRVRASTVQQLDACDYVDGHGVGRDEGDTSCYGDEERSRLRLGCSWSSCEECIVLS